MPRTCDATFPAQRLVSAALTPAGPAVLQGGGAMSGSSIKEMSRLKGVGVVVLFRGGGGQMGLGVSLEVGVIERLFKMNMWSDTRETSAEPTDASAACTLSFFTAPVNTYLPSSRPPRTPPRAPSSTSSPSSPSRRERCCGHYGLLLKQACSCSCRHGSCGGRCGVLLKQDCSRSCCCSQCGGRCGVLLT